MRRCLPALLVLLAVWAPVASAADSGFPALQALRSEGAAVSAMAVSLPDGRPLWSLDARRRLSPASITKLYTAAAVLDHWGPNGTFTTRLLAASRPSDSTVDGDLVFLGAGDPALTEERLWELGARLRDAGVTRVTGDLIINQSRFGAVPCLTSDRCRARESTNEAYNAPLSAAGVNYGTWCTLIAPASHSGQPARTRFCSFDLPSMDLHGRVRTTGEGDSPKLRVTRDTAGGRDRIAVAGSIPVDSDAVRVYRSVSNAARHTGIIFRRILSLLGVHVVGDVVVANKRPPDSLHRIAAVDSLSISEQIRRMLTFSNNYMADTLALDLLADDSGADTTRPLTLPRAGAHLAELGRSLSAPVGEGGDSPVVLLSGSGLTDGNRVSGADVVALLRGIYGRPDLFPSFLGALTVPRYSPLSIMEGDNPAWMTRIAAKTGSMFDPVTVLGVAGYFRTRDGGWGAFAMIINGRGSTSNLSYGRGMKALRKDVGTLLSRY